MKLSDYLEVKIVNKPKLGEVFEFTCSQESVSGAIVDIGKNGVRLRVSKKTALNLRRYLNEQFRELEESEKFLKKRLTKRVK